MPGPLDRPRARSVLMAGPVSGPRRSGDLAALVAGPIP